MKKNVVILFGVLLVLLLASTASAHGLDSAKLEKAGWQCMIAGPHDWVHCFPPGAPITKGMATTVKVFECTTEEPECEVIDAEAGLFEGVGHPFLGTELLINDSVYAGQPCVTDNGEEYHLLDNGFRACHHFVTSDDDPH